MLSSNRACTMGSACRTAVMVTANRPEAVTTPPAARPPFTRFSAVASQPVLAVFPATRSLLDQIGGALVSTVRATASCCCSLAKPGAMLTTSPESPPAVASAALINCWRKPSVPSSHHCLQVGLPHSGGSAAGVAG